MSVLNEEKNLALRRQLDRWLWRIVLIQRFPVAKLLWKCTHQKDRSLTSGNLCLAFGYKSVGSKYFRCASESYLNKNQCFKLHFNIYPSLLFFYSNQNKVRTFYLLVSVYMQTTKGVIKILHCQSKNPGYFCSVLLFCDLKLHRIWNNIAFTPHTEWPVFYVTFRLYLCPPWLSLTL